MSISNNSNIPVNKDLMRLIVCPVTGGNLYYDQTTNLVISESAKISFPVREGIPILIRSEARPLIND
tara:strand:+ start:929 stop:1129 length:201 start_codon:yes stop_codon:yes gene_type:complete